MWCLKTLWANNMDGVPQPAVQWKLETVCIDTWVWDSIMQPRLCETHQATFIFWDFLLFPFWWWLVQYVLANSVDFHRTLLPFKEMISHLKGEVCCLWCCVCLCLLLCVCCVCLLVLQLALLNHIKNPDLELAIAMLIVPFFVNVSLLFNCVFCGHWFYSPSHTNPTYVVVTYVGYRLVPHDETSFPTVFCVLPLGPHVLGGR